MLNLEKCWQITQSLKYNKVLSKYKHLRGNSDIPQSQYPTANFVQLQQILGSFECNRVHLCEEWIPW